MKIKFGPAGLGGVDEAITNLGIYQKLGFSACEIEFTYGVYIKNKTDAVKIGEAAKKLGITLSIHAHYWINLNSEDEEKVRKSRERILECCKIGTWLGAKAVVFHPGFYGKKPQKETYEKIKSEINKVQEEIKENNYTPRLAPETTGKVNVFGSVDEILNLTKETDCSFCIDFAHILARYKNYNFEEVFRKFKEHKDFHLHFSGIEYSEKGERKHKRTSEKEFKELFLNLPRDKNITIINESPDPVEDSVLGLSLLNKHK